MRHLALDGPMNGSYIDDATAIENAYVLVAWDPGLTDEEVFVHESSSHLHGLDPEDEAAIVSVVAEAPLN